MRSSVALVSAVLAVLATSARVARAQSHVSCVGDSITQGSGSSSPSTTYPAVLQGLLGTVFAVENDGHSGTTLLKSGDLPYWNQAEYPTSTAWVASGGDVVIQLGTNDSKPRNWMDKASFRADCEALVDHYRSGSPSTRVWISLPPPATSAACCKIDGTVIANEIVPLLGQCAANKGATTIDVHGAFAGKTNLLTDGVHPNDQGAALIAQTVYDALKKMPTISIAVTPGTSSVSLTATPAAAYGKVEKVRFFDGTKLLGEITAAPWKLDDPKSVGAHVYSAQVVETAGRTATAVAEAHVVEGPDGGGVQAGGAGAGAGGGGGVSGGVSGGGGGGGGVSEVDGGGRSGSGCAIGPAVGGVSSAIVLIGAIAVRTFRRRRRR